MNNFQLNYNLIIKAKIILRGIFKIKLFHVFCINFLLKKMSIIIILYVSFQIDYSFELLMKL